MKNLLTLTMLLASVFTFAQNENPINLIYEKDEFTGNEYLKVEPNLLVSEDGVKGFVLYPYLSRKGDKWVYTAIGGTSTIGGCFENDKIFIVFENGTTFNMTAWTKFNCKGSIGFDLYGKYRNELFKSMKAIRFQNGVNYNTFEMKFTEENDKNYFVNFFKALDEYNATH